MKKLFILALIAIATGTSAFASDSKATEHFAAAFSNAKNVSWKTETRFTQVNFVLDNENVTAFYDNEGDLIGSSKNIAFDRLPKKAIETITTKYTFPQYQVKDCLEFTKATNEKNYYVSFETAKNTIVLEISEAGMISLFEKIKK